MNDMNDYEIFHNKMELVKLLQFMRGSTHDIVNDPWYKNFKFPGKIVRPLGWDVVEMSPNELPTLFPSPRKQGEGARRTDEGLLMRRSLPPFDSPNVSALNCFANAEEGVIYLNEKSSSVYTLGMAEPVSLEDDGINLTNLSQQLADGYFKKRVVEMLKNKGYIPSQPRPIGIEKKCLKDTARTVIIRADVKGEVQHIFNTRHHYCNCMYCNYGIADQDSHLKIQAIIQYLMGQIYPNFSPLRYVDDPVDPSWYSITGGYLTLQEYLYDSTEKTNVDKSLDMKLNILLSLATAVRDIHYHGGVLEQLPPSKVSVTQQGDVFFQEVKQEGSVGSTCGTTVHKNNEFRYWAPEILRNNTSCYGYSLHLESMDSFNNLDEATLQNTSKYRNSPHLFKCGKEYKMWGRHDDQWHLTDMGNLEKEISWLEGAKIDIHHKHPLFNRFHKGHNPRSYSEPTDVFSLCILMNEILTEKIPYLNDPSNLTGTGILHYLGPAAHIGCMHQSGDSLRPVFYQKSEFLKLILEGGTRTQPEERWTADTLVSLLQYAKELNILHAKPESEAAIAFNALLIDLRQANQEYLERTKEDREKAEAVYAETAKYIYERPSPGGQTSAKNAASATPHPPCGHLLPVSGEKGIMREVLWERTGWREELKTLGIWHETADFDEELSLDIYAPLTRRARYETAHPDALVQHIELSEYIDNGLMLTVQLSKHSENLVQSLKLNVPQVRYDETNKTLRLCFIASTHVDFTNMITALSQHCSIFPKISDKFERYVMPRIQRCKRFLPGVDLNHTLRERLYFATDIPMGQAPIQSDTLLQRLFSTLSNQEKLDAIGFSKKQLSPEDRALYETFCCPIGYGIMNDPVYAPGPEEISKHQFDRKWIVRILSDIETHPFTQTPLHFSDLKSNVELKKQIDLFVNRMVLEYKNQHTDPIKFKIQATENAAFDQYKTWNADTSKNNDNRYRLFQDSEVLEKIEDFHPDKLHSL